MISGKSSPFSSATISRTAAIASPSWPSPAPRRRAPACARNCRSNSRSSSGPNTTHGPARAHRSLTISRKRTSLSRSIAISSALPKALRKASPDSPPAAAAWARRRKRCPASTRSKAVSRSPAAWRITVCACLRAASVEWPRCSPPKRIGMPAPAIVSLHSPIPISTHGSRNWPKI